MEPIINNNNILLRNTTHDILQQIKPKSKIIGNDFKTIIPLDIKNQIVLCHKTANELLNQFWVRFLSSEKTIISQLPQIVNSLKKTSSRIDSIIKSNNITINKLEIVKNYFKPTIIAIMKALEEYKNLGL
ncbi:uncharacterized protein T551_02762 [Pneumocystis jirovecii RU7]|uniref:Uncharacterized protein n=1 Tax=Pneumocystis jirovecii (strain RU7) TaxID=1408657 RepID=A0A0W4ZJ04_PNEJ7|nr:uncharacterized protein T551_02762 [Pneumocystis jirovecii RU7]KTW28343.1 hypothetical protein T551_02762 [Pneumocystis jirovecii RU7]